MRNDKGLRQDDGWSDRSGLLDGDEFAKVGVLGGLQGIVDKGQDFEMNAPWDF